MMVDRSNTKKDDSLIFCFNTLKFIMILIFFISVMPYAHSDSPEKIYCPSKIICLRDNDLSSCSHTAENSPYWGHIWYTSSPHRVFAGEYNFHLVDAPYHASFVSVSQATQDNMLVCQYINEQKREPLGIIAKPEPNLEAYNANTTQWIINATGPDRARCFSEDTQDCPVKEASSLAIFNNFDSSLRVSVHDSGVPVYFHHEAGYHTIRYDDILPYCYAENLCKLDFFTASDGNIGSVVVDLDNAMRIIKIIFEESSIGDIVQNVPFNSIKIEKTSKKVPSIDINNEINTNLLANVNGKINISVNSRKTETIGFNRILSACSGFGKCTINIGINSDQPNVGAVTVDMQDNMKIIEVISSRSSQIIVRQADTSNLINISYPNLR